MIKPVFIFFTETRIIVMTVSHWSQSIVDVRWMNDPNLSGEVSVPSVDLVDKEFIFGPDEPERALQKYAELVAAQLR